MYISSLSEFRSKIEEFFDQKARYLATHRHEEDRERGYVQFLLYGNLQFSFVIASAPYTSLGVARQLEGGFSVSEFISADLTFIENREDDVNVAFNVVDEYCRLLLPERFIEAFSQKHRASQ